MKKTTKADIVIDNALELLKTQGDHGVTMRQVAQQAGMSLSNVQYYFKTKDDLLMAMANRYFYKCLDDVKAEESFGQGKSLEVNLRGLVKSFLSHGHELSEMCRIFREYWAIATRNDVIETYLRNYYQEMSSILTDKLRHVSDDDRSIALAVTLLIPYAEGYSITALSMPLDLEESVSLITETLATILR